MLIFCFSFAGMIYVVSDSISDDMQLEEKQVDQIEMLNKAINNHPIYYGLKKLSNHTGFFNETFGDHTDNGLSQLSNMLKNISNPNNRTDVAPGMIVHPLYVFLQQRSPIL